MKLVKLNTDHYIIVDDSEIKEGDWMIRNGEQPILVTPNFWWDFGVRYKKITHSTQPLGFLNEYGSTADLKCDWTNVKFLPISEVKELIGEVDVDITDIAFKACQKQDTWTWTQFQYIFPLGYNQALEDNKGKVYTEEDMREMFEMGIGLSSFSDTDENKFRYALNHIQPKTEWEVEFVDGKLKNKS